MAEYRRGQRPNALPQGAATALNEATPDELALENPEIPVIFAPGMGSAIAELLAKEKLSARDLKAGDRLIFGKNVIFQILWPNQSYLDSWYQGGYGKDPNSTSLVIKASFGSFDVLFTGDAESEVLSQISLSDVEILKVSHQGSRGAVTPEDLGRIKPEVGIIFVGKNNYGHPSREIIELLKNANVKTYRTDRDGTVKIETDGKSWSVKK